MVILLPLFTCRGEQSVSRQTGASRTTVCLTAARLQDFTAPLIEIICSEYSKFKSSTTDENK